VRGTHVELFFGTTNPGKLRELARLVEGLSIRVVAPGDLGRRLPEVEEDGETFAENAAKKATAWARFSGLHALADDSGLCVDVLGGEPGVRSARWSEEGPHSAAERDERNNDKLLRSLAAVEDERRGAEYRAVLAVARPDGTIVASVTGACRGRIGRERRGSGGFGYDPLFVPEVEARLGADGANPPRTMAELPATQKDALSHRGDAFRKLRPVLEALARGGRP